MDNRNIHVLLVDNNQDIVDLLQLHLNEFGITQIEKASGVKEAKQALDKSNYDLIFLDWILEDGDCFDILKYEKKLSNDNLGKKQLFKIVVTGKDHPDDIAMLKKYNVDEHFIKPFTWNEFKAKFEAVLVKLK